MSTNRRVWQHEFEDRSESQLSDAFESVGWVVQRLRRDYGEDLYARPFENGNPTGQDFFIQLKGTDDIEQFRLKAGDWLSYPIELPNLAQWYSFTVPVILIIWDITSKAGCWMHVQPFIRSKLASDPAWLENRSEAREPRRQVRIPTKQTIAEDHLACLKSVIQAEWRKIEQGRAHFEIIYSARTHPSDDTLNPQLPPAITHQLRITELQAIVTANPDEARGWLDLASVYYDTNNMSEALKAINRAWSLDPGDRNIRHVRACVLAEFAERNDGRASMLHEAISLFQSTRSGPIDPTADYNIGNCYSELGQFQKAVEHYDKALSAEPEPQQAAQMWTNRGNALGGIGDAEQAVQSFENAIGLHPSLWNAHASWAALEVRREHFEEACEHFHAAFYCNPELQHSGDGVVYWFAYSLWQVGRYEEALSTTDDLLAVSPAHKEALLLKSSLLSQLSHSDDRYAPEAIAFFRSRLLDDPADMHVRSELQRLYSEQGLESELRGLLEETASFEGAPATVLYAYAKLLECDGRASEAMVCLERAATEQLTDAQLYHAIVHTLARLKRQAGIYDEAIAYYEMALENVSDPLPILEKISDCYHLLNDYLSCVVVISRALLLGTSETLWWHNLYYALHKLEIEPTRYMDFFASRLYSGADVTDQEIRAELNALMNSAT